jgi:hypothetical protein
VDSPVGGHHAGEEFGLFRNQPQADKPSPVLADQVDILEPQPHEPLPHPYHVAAVAVILAPGRLVRASETHQVGGHGPKAGLHQHWDHLPVEVGPGRLAVEHEHNLSFRVPFVQVVDAEGAALAVGDLLVMGLEGIARQVLEPFLGSAQYIQDPSSPLFSGFRPSFPGIAGFPWVGDHSMLGRINFSSPVLHCLFFHRPRFRAIDDDRYVTPA